MDGPEVPPTARARTKARRALLATMDEPSKIEERIERFDHASLDDSRATDSTRSSGSGQDPTKQRAEKSQQLHSTTRSWTMLEARH